ncbi:MAG: nucleotidyltransferase domain-containing protein [Lachnospiraceae bacterium]|nr:nucleotidyltransferase domain-containing protein [Lachnospiraceae bacterium]
MPGTIQTLLSEYLSEIQKVYGYHLKSIILYGSYARGDYTADSDVDIMILVDLPEEELEQYSDALSELGFNYN